MDELRIDVSDLISLGRDLDAVPVKALVETRKAVQRGALNIKKDTQRRWSGMRHLRHLPAAVTYDTHETLTGASAEIGPDRSRPQGKLGNIAEYGAPPKTAPRPGLAPSLEAEEPKFRKALEDVAVKATRL